MCSIKSCKMFQRKDGQGTEGGKCHNMVCFRKSILGGECKGSPIASTENENSLVVVQKSGHGRDAVDIFMGQIKI